MRRIFGSLKLFAIDNEKYLKEKFNQNKNVFKPQKKNIIHKLKIIITTFVRQMENILHLFHKMICIWQEVSIQLNLENI